MKAEVLEIGLWLKRETTPVEDVVSKVLERLKDEDPIVRRTWAKVALEIRNADWPKMFRLMRQKLVSVERYEMFKDLLCKKIDDYWAEFLKQHRHGQGYGI
jgi:chromatin segregation and condensation protein Rec8/ScpA/Scc1 (kleisin family)